MANLQILPAEGWPFHQMTPDYREEQESGAIVWREVSAQFYEDMLGVVPPINWQGPAFMVGEPYTDGRHGAVHAMLVKLNGRYFARYVPRVDFRAAFIELSQHLIRSAS